MTDAIDDMFSRDLEKLAKGLPSELAANAASVSAAQRDDKKGAEKPDLYARGKGRGKGGRVAEDEENDERKSKGPNKGEKKEPEAMKRDKEQGAKTAGLRDMYMKSLDEEQKKSNPRKAALQGGLAGAVGGGTGAYLGAGRHLTGKHRAAAILGGVVGGGIGGAAGGGLGFKMRKKILKKMKAKDAEKAEKKASLDEAFDADMRQVVGMDPVDAPADWERPDVSIPDQVTDAIDESFLGWMRERADDDVVKEASVAEVVKEAKGGSRMRDLVRQIRGGSYGQGEKALKKGLGIAAGVAGAGGVAAGAAGGYAAGKRKREKTAGVVANDENKDLLERIRASARKGFRHGCSDV